MPFITLKAKDIFLDVSVVRNDLQNSVSFFWKTRETKALYKILRIFINSQSFTRRHFSKMSPSPVKKAKIEDENSSLADQFAERRESAGENVEKFKFNMKRVKFLTGNEGFLHREAKGVAYYMHRDQRLQDNWAALFAQKLALADNLPLYVIAGISGL